MSVAIITVNGSHHATRFGKYNPAQNTNAYTTLKFNGITPGIRDTARTRTKMAGKMTWLFTGGILAGATPVSNSLLSQTVLFAQMESRGHFQARTGGTVRFFLRHQFLDQCRQ